MSIRAPRGAPIDQRIRLHSVVTPGGCWEWIGATNGTGYGRINIQIDGKDSYKGVHRVAYEHYVGPIPEGLTIDHLCRNRACCNPAHLEAVTLQENTLRGQSPGAISKRTNQCRNGHAYTPENTYVWRTKRFCRACKAAGRPGPTARRAADGEALA